MRGKDSRGNKSRCQSILSAMAAISTIISTHDTHADWWRPTPGMSWQIQYSGKVDTSLTVEVYNLDLFETLPAAIQGLHTAGKRVICYFSAGSLENWRPDAARFPRSALGKKVDGWPGERWLDIRRLDVLMPIMQDRMELAAAKGCDAVDPDLVEAYAESTGFPLGYHDQLRYNMALADTAHALGLAVGLKNDLGQIPDLLPYFDFAVNEECFDYRECAALKPFIAAGKPVFGIEYRRPWKSFCPKANALNFDFLLKRRKLDAWRKACR